MEEKSFYVKENSVQEFCDKYIVDPNAERMDERNRNKLNPYYIFGKESVFIRNDFFKVATMETRIQIELRDRSEGTRAELVNTYLYSINPYDGLLYELKLIDFSVKHVNGTGK